MPANFSDRFSPADAVEFKRVVDAVAESVLEMSDEEIHQETIEDGENPVEVAEAARGVLLKALSSADRKAEKTTPAQGSPEDQREDVTRAVCLDDWDSLYVTLYRSLLRMIRSLYPHMSAEAEDCAQEAIVKLYQRRDWQLLKLNEVPAEHRWAQLYRYLWATAKVILRDRMRRDQLKLIVDPIDGTRSFEAQLNSEQRSVQAETHLNAFQKRQLTKQLFQSTFLRLREQFCASLEAERSRLEAQSPLAKTKIDVEKDAASSIREAYLNTLARAGIRVEMTELDFISEFEVNLRAVRERLQMQDLDDSAKERIMQMSSEAFDRVYRRLMDLTTRIAPAADKLPRPAALVFSDVYANLTPEDRFIVHERVVRRKSYLQIQQGLRDQGTDVSASSLKMRYGRALKKLRSVVEQEVGSGEIGFNSGEHRFLDDLKSSLLLLGDDGAGRPIRLGPQERAWHMQVIGGTGSGKSKFLEWMIRGDLREGRGFALLDPHGDLYDAVVKYCAHQVLNREIILLNVSGGDSILGFNPFRKAETIDLSTQVDRRITATLHAWSTEAAQAPRLAEWLRTIFTVMLTHELTVAEVQHLFVCDGQHRVSALRDLLPAQDDHARRALESLFTKSSWDDMPSGRNRLLEFLTSRALTQLMGIPERTLDLREIMDAGKVLLVNLAPSSHLSNDNARVFGSLLVNELFEAAMARHHAGRERRPFYVYMDEVQNFLSADIATMLAEARRFGLYAVLAHQSLDQLDYLLRDAVFANCRIKAVFGGLPESSARVIAEQMFLRDLDPTRIFVAIYQMNCWGECSEDVWRAVVKRLNPDDSNFGKLQDESRGPAFDNLPFDGSEECYGPDEWFASSASSSSSWYSRTEGASHGSTEGFSGIRSESWSCGTSECVTDVPAFIPVPRREITRVQYRTREEELRELVKVLKKQYARHCFIKLGDQQIQPMRVPFVESFKASERTLDYYVKRLLAKQGAISAEEADDLIATAMRALSEEDRTGGGRKLRD